MIALLDQSKVPPHGKIIAVKRSTEREIKQIGLDVVIGVVIVVFVLGFMLGFIVN
jgi:hypothetical protein